MSRYAEKTSVSSERSRGEIEKTLVRYGASGFAYGTQSNLALIMFQMKGKRVKFVLPLPDLNSKSITHDGRGSKRSPQRQRDAWEQACRQKWRALALAIKAKLEAVESQITSFEDEFLSYIVLPNGSTVSQVVLPEIEKSYQSGNLPPLLGFGG